MEVEPILLETEKHLVSKFMDEMLPTKLFFHSPTDVFGDKVWVFWSHNTSINCHLQDRIKSALSCYHPLIWANGLVQFWAAEEIRGQLHLTTTLQPFALSPNEKMMEYRKHCVKEYKLLVQEEESAGIVGRVFRNQLPEFGKELKYYIIKEYPQRDLALSCGFNSTLAMPVFEPSGHTCVGVLELLLFHAYDYLSSFILKWVCHALKKQRLSTTDVGSFRSRILNIEIKIAVEQVCKTYNLPLGFTWVSSKYISTSKKPQVSFQGELLVPCSGMSLSASGSISPYYWNTPLRGHQGLVGKAFSSGNLHFCKDVCELSITEYPQLLVARWLGIAACFAVCLRNISTGNQEFVIEFSVYREMTIHSRDLHSLLYSILATMKQHLRSFEVITGNREIEIFTEVHKASEQNNNDLTSYMAISTPTTSEGDSSQSLRTTECSMNSTCRQPVLPSWMRVNESDQFIPQSSFPVIKSAQRAESESSGWGNSETASSNWVKLFGYTIYGNQSDIPISNQSRMTESLHFGTPISEASAIYEDVEMRTDVELMTIKVSYRDDIIKFNLPPSSSYAYLMENILIRWRFLKDKAFVIKYLNDLLEPILLATDTDLQECMVMTTSKGIKLIKMVIQMENDVQSMP